MRKALLMLLVAVLLIAGSGLAESDGVLTSGDFSYRLDKYERATVLSMSGVTEIRANAFRDLELKSLTLPAGITEIPEKMCLEQEKLEKITIPDHVTVIRREAFKKCKKLNKVTLPAGLKEIGAEAFSGCKNLKQIALGADVAFIDPTAFQECAKNFTIIASEGSYAAAFAAENGYKFKKAK